MPWQVAFLRGQNTERAILNRGLGQLMATQRWHALLRIRKSLADNIAKFQGLLVGGIFVHIPFLLRKDVSEGERVSSFRATEELMLRCGSAFTEASWPFSSLCPRPVSAKPSQASVQQAERRPAAEPAMQAAAESATGAALRRLFLLCEPP